MQNFMQNSYQLFVIILFINQNKTFSLWSFKSIDSQAINVLKVEKEKCEKYFENPLKFTVKLR